MELKHIACDVCGSMRPSVVGFPPIEDRLARKFPSLSGVAVVRCRNCGFYFLDPLPVFTAHELSFIYDSAYFEAAVLTEWYARRRAAQRIRRVKKIEQYSLSPGKTLLDVGCGEGWLMYEAQRRGWDVHGLDVSNNLDPRIREQFDSRLTLGELAQAGFAAESFDAIYLDSVLEHVRSPKIVLEECRRILCRGGCIYIGVPNEDRLVNDVKQRKSQLYGRHESSRLSPFHNPYHIVGFNRDSFGRLAGSLSFRIAELRIFAGHYEWLKYRRSLPARGEMFAGFWVHLLGLVVGRGYYIESWLVKTEEHNNAP